MDFSKIPEPLIEPNKMGFLGKAFLASLATTLVVNGTMLPYYRLSVESIHKDCLEVGEALEKEGLSKGWDRTKRTFNQWRQDGLFSSVDENSTLEARAEACENLGPLVRANIWYAEQVILPIEENWVITIGRRDPSTLDAGKKIALETAHQTKEGVSNAYERTRDWAIQSWDGLWGDQDEATQDIDIVPPQERAPLLFQHHLLKKKQKETRQHTMKMATPLKNKALTGVSAQKIRSMALIGRRGINDEH